MAGLSRVHEGPGGLSRPHKAPGGGGIRSRGLEVPGREGSNDSWLAVRSCAQPISSAVGVKYTCRTRAEVSRLNCGYAVRSIDVIHQPARVPVITDAPRVVTLCGPGCVH